MIEERADFIPYPEGFLRQIFRLPILMHRAGIGWLLRPFRLLVVTVEGRKSGKPRHAVLEYRRHGSKLYVISAWGERPQWYKNIVANPLVTVQFGIQERAARAQRVNDSAEALRALYMFQRTSPMYEAILAGLSSAEEINLRTLKSVHGEFTIVRFDLLQQNPPLYGVRPTHRWLGLGIVLGIASLFIWTLVARNKDREPDARQAD